MVAVLGPYEALPYYIHMTNYRPVSLLSFFSKVVEKVI
jgi:hypothetical protein